MQDIEVAPIEKELLDILQNIVNNKKFDKIDIDKWSYYLKLIIKRIKEIEELCVVEDLQNEQEREVQKRIQRISEKIIKHLNETFNKEPPFTIVRLAELIIDPSVCGYSLNSNKSIVKYFNSLERIILVSSSISNYPEPSFGADLKTKTSWEPSKRKQNAVNVELVEIPWLKNGTITHGTEAPDQKNKEYKEGGVDQKVDGEDQKVDGEDQKEDGEDQNKDNEKEESSLLVQEKETDDMLISPPLQDVEKTPLEGEKIAITKEVYGEMQRKSKSGTSNDVDNNNDLEKVKKRPGSSGQGNLTPTKKSKNVDDIDEIDEDNMEISQSEITDV